MSSQIKVLAERMSREAQTPIVRRLRTLLTAPDARVVVSGVEPVPASQLESTWRVRQQIAHTKRRRIFGLPGLLTQLRTAEHRPIRVIGAIDERESGTLFFDATSDSFLGAVVVTMSEQTRAYYQGRLHSNPFDGASEPALLV